MRTYLIDGGTDVRVYRNSTWGNLRYVRYVPRYTYHRDFYGWVSQPWRQPVTYAWDSGPALLYYDGYVRPEAVYAGPVFWLADYLMLANLQMAYNNRVMANSGAASRPPEAMTPMRAEVRALLAEHIGRQIEIEQSMANVRPDAGAAPPALDPRRRVFVVHVDVDIEGSGGQLCGLSPGDVLQRTSEAPSSDGRISVMVLSSKNPSCPESLQGSIDLGTLQDMDNQFREQIAAGLGKLAATAGRSGIPSAPAAASVPFPEGQAVADTSAPELLAAQLKEADLVEEEARLAAESSI